MTETKKTLADLKSEDMGKEATIVAQGVTPGFQWRGKLSAWGGCYGLEPHDDFGWMPILATDEVTIHGE